MNSSKGRWCALLVIMCGALGGSVLGQNSGALNRNPRVVSANGPESFTSRVVASGFESPWELAWGPDGFLWITERVGKRVTRVNPSDGSRHVAVTIQEVEQSRGQDGLMGMALHPDLLQGKGNDFVYVAYTYDADPGAALALRAKIRRYVYDRATQTLGSPVDVLTGLPHGTDHGGSRLAIGPDGKLYVSRGDHGSNFLANYCDVNRAQDLPTAAEIRAQDWSSYQGKILRLNVDGSIPSDNPSINGVRSHIYSYGHRNPQGMVFAGGRLYASEHGESIDDELNLILPGRNYGWPLIAGFQDDQSYVYANWSASSPAPCTSLKFDVLNPPPSVPRKKESESKLKDFTAPVRTFFTVPNGYDLRTLGNATAAPAGLDVYSSNAIPGWSDSLLLATMVSGVVYRMKLLPGDGTRVGDPVAYFKTGNRYRDVAVSPDGRKIYVVTDSDSRTVGPDGVLTRTLANPGAILEFTYSASGSRNPVVR
jgi:PQQ-dependent dehydrogenase (s-GDH family)